MRLRKLRYFVFFQLTNNPVWYAMGTNEMYDFLSNPFLLEYYRKGTNIYGMIQGMYSSTIVNVKTLLFCYQTSIL